MFDEQMNETQRTSKIIEADDEADLLVLIGKAILELLPDGHKLKYLINSTVEQIEKNRERIHLAYKNPCRDCGGSGYAYIGLSNPPKKIMCMSCGGSGISASDPSIKKQTVIEYVSGDKGRLSG